MIKNLQINLATEDDKLKESLDSFLKKLEIQKLIKIKSHREERLSWLVNELENIEEIMWEIDPLDVGVVDDIFSAEETILSKPKYIWLITINNPKFFKIEKEYKWPITLEKRLAAVFEISKSIINNPCNLVSEKLSYNGKIHKIQIADANYLNYYM
ncbi:MAG: hypothetical protein V1815_00555 [Candidatus Woesearchaeota archaeon]